MNGQWKRIDDEHRLLPDVYVDWRLRWVSGRTRGLRRMPTVRTFYNKNRVPAMSVSPEMTPVSEEDIHKYLLND